ncbi:MAG: SCP2 sterol-binding domain-containing protein [Myxococcota bacterium]|nr:SCP2 sterol-binding domain-containing protein [Myxococcota bacterium]
MPLREIPPDDITPEDFFTVWVPRAVAGDPVRRARLGHDELTLEFAIEGDGGGLWVLMVERGEVRGGRGPAGSADLRVRVDLETWRSLNRGEMSAPEAFLRRRVRLEGNLLLAVKLHLILG